MSQVELLCDSFNQLTGQSLSLSGGVAYLKTSNESHWWLEIDPSEQVLTIHQGIAAIEPDSASFWMKMNSNLSMLKGAWLSFHEKTQSVRLSWMQGIAHLDARSLINSLNNLDRVKEQLIQEKAQTSETIPTHFMVV